MEEIPQGNLIIEYGSNESDLMQTNDCDFQLKIFHVETLTGESEKIDISTKTVNPSTLSGTMPRATGSRLEQLLTAGKNDRTGSLDSGSSVAAGGNSGTSGSTSTLGDDTPVLRETAESEKSRNPCLTLKYNNSCVAAYRDQNDSPKSLVALSPETPRNPRKRQLNNTANTGDLEQLDKDVHDKAKKIIKSEQSKARNSVSSEGNSCNNEESKEGEIQNNDNVTSDNNSPGAKPVKPKDDYEYMGAQIEKLLRMPASTEFRWKSTDDRKFKCKTCSKSFPNGEELKSHIAEHSVEEKEKSRTKERKSREKKETKKVSTEVSPKRKSANGQEPKARNWNCRCGEKFASKSSLYRHEKKEHPKNKTNLIDNIPKPDLVSVNEGDANIINDIKNSDGAADNCDPPQLSLEVSSSSPVAVQAAFSIISTGILGKSKNEDSKDSRRHRANAQSSSSTMPSTRSGRGGKTKSKPNDISNSKSGGKNKLNSKISKRASSEEQEEEEEDLNSKSPTRTPPVITGRTPSRRNIQKPKWLTDSDLVTDYELPGTNAMRSSVAVTPTPSNMTNGNKSSPSPADSKKVPTGSNKSDKSKSEKNKPSSSPTPPTQNIDQDSVTAASQSSLSGQGSSSRMSFDSNSALSSGPFSNLESPSFADISSGKFKIQTPASSASLHRLSLDSTNSNLSAGPFAEVQSVTFADISAGKVSMSEVKKLKPRTTSTLTEEEKREVEEQERRAKTIQLKPSAIRLEPIPLPPPPPASAQTNDETQEMPVLKAEASSVLKTPPMVDNVDVIEQLDSTMKSIDENQENLANSNTANSIVPTIDSIVSEENNENYDDVPQVFVTHDEEEDPKSNVQSPASPVLPDDVTPMDRDDFDAEDEDDDNDEEGEFGDDESNVIGPRHGRRNRSASLSMRSCGSGSQSEKLQALDDASVGQRKDKCTSPTFKLSNECLGESDSDFNDSLMSEFSELAAQVSEQTDGFKLKEDGLRFLNTRVSSKHFWRMRKELKRLRTEKGYFQLGKLTPLAAVLMQDMFCPPMSRCPRHDD